MQIPGRKGAAAGLPRPRPSRATRRQNWILFAFAAPALLLYVVFFVVPTLQSVQYSVTNWDGYSPSFDYVGLDNFVRALTNDDLFLNALANNLKFWLVVVIFQTFFALILAIFLMKESRGSSLLRGVFFFPTILSSISVAYIWKFIYDPNFGLGNRILEAVGLGQFSSAFLGDDRQAIYWVALTQVWFHAGQMMTIFVAGLQSVPSELYEAAEVDGASRWRRFRHVTWPMIAPATAIVLAYTTIQAFKAFDLILGLGGNPPKGSLDIMSTRIYTTFANGEFGYAAAQSLLFVATIGIVTWLLKRGAALTQPSSE
ncbi:MAG: sugar ABC transporter permease [Propioniciclava sp.]|uniref:carbohydrate ABC transporter permease n=1 Tax=Propioniciclava sp. TaxID=2038686 RepID=UPI0039E35581